VGDVIRVPSGRRSGLAVVLDVSPVAFGEPRPLVLTEDRWAGRLAAAEFTSPVEPLASLRVPKNFNHRSPQERRDLAAALRQVASGQVGLGSARRTRSNSGSDDEVLADLRRRLRRHPCHACPDREEHARWAERRARLDRDTVALRTRVANRTGSLARTFDRVCTLLESRGYLSDGTVTPAGRMLSRIWTEADLLVAECLRQRIWEGLNPAELAAAVSVAVYEARRETDERIAVPRGAVGEAIMATMDIWAGLETAEAAHGLAMTREPDLGFVWPIYRWARGESLAKVLASTSDLEMPAGDFVRWARQVLDLLGQIEAASPPAPAVRGSDTPTLEAQAREPVAVDGGSPEPAGEGAVPQESASDGPGSEPRPTVAAGPVGVRATARAAIAAVNRGVLAYATAV
jgi:ATP-dependent RNA helicase HelY